MKIVWIGPLVNPSSLSRFRAISPAANRWQLSLIRALSGNGANLVSISYLPEPFWPKGKIVPELRVEELVDGVSGLAVKYLNVPYLRELFLFWSLRRALEKLDFDCLITYNPLKRHVLIGHYVQTVRRKKWISIIADGVSIGTPSGQVFLSYRSYNHCRSSTKIHLDGGVDFLVANDGRNVLQKGNDKKVVLYAGALNKWTGIERLAAQFGTIGMEGIELHIFGKNPSAYLKNLASMNQNIFIHGFVSNEHYSNACLKADCFINPRPCDLANSENNFPSKLLDYMSYGKPIISTRTPGISAVYENLLFYYDSENVESLKNTLGIVLRLSPRDLVCYRRKLQDFAEDHTWAKQAERFLEFLLKQ